MNPLAEKTKDMKTIDFRDIYNLNTYYGFVHFKTTEQTRQ
jgi:hypothetical protein